MKTLGERMAQIINETLLSIIVRHFTVRVRMPVNDNEGR